MPDEPRFIVNEYGPRSYAVQDTATGLSYDLSATREAAQRDADWRNRVNEETAQ